MPKYVIILFPMQKAGANNRRKQYGGLQPTLPRRTVSRQQGKRTIYQQLPALSQQLKQYRRRLLLNNISELNPVKDKSANQNVYKMNTRYDEHRKDNQTLMNMGSENDARKQQLLQVSKLMAQAEQEQAPQIKLNMDDPNQLKNQQGNEIDEPNNQNNQNNNNEAEIEGYTMGVQVQVQEEQQDPNKFVPKLKPYSRHEFGWKITDKQELTAEKRMELKYLQKKFQLVRARRQDNQVLQFIESYKLNKQRVLKDSNKRMQAAKSLASIKKCTSLPKLSHANCDDKIMQIVVPSFQQLNSDENPQQTKRKILKKRLEGSISFGRLQMATERKKDSYQQRLDKQLEQLIDIQQKLRQKGVKLNSAVLKNSLLNVRQLPLNEFTRYKSTPSSNLISNPYHPKQAPKKKKKK